MRSRRVTPFFAGLLFCAMAAPAGAGEDSLIGLSAGYTSRFEKGFVTADLFVPLGKIVDLDVSAQFVDLGRATRYVFSADAIVNFPLDRIRPRVFAFAGGGLGVVLTDKDNDAESTTRDGVISLLAGVGYDARATPFVQIKLQPHGEVLFSVGVRFW
jgi:hypothetical protein